MQYFIEFLGTLAAFVSPAAGVIISEYFFVSKGKLNRKEGFYWPGIIAWAVGGIGALFLPFFIPALNGMIIAIIVYYLFHIQRKN